MKRYIFAAIAASTIAIAGYFLFFNLSESEQLEELETPQEISIELGEKPYRLGFTGLEDGLTANLRIQGSIPSWLHGSLLRVGPGQFIINNTRARLWLDGLAMLHKFSISNSHIVYSNKLLDTRYKTDVIKRGTMQRRPAIAGSSMFSKCLSMLSSSSRKRVYDNANVNIIHCNGNCVACPEAPYPVTVAPDTLGVTEFITFKDKAGGQYSTAHPYYDTKTNEWTNFLVNLGRTSTYQFYTMQDGTNKRKILWQKKVKRPAYMHSFAITEHYAILIEPPFTINPADLLYDNKPFLKHFKWQPENGTNIIVVDRKTGKTVGEYKTDAFFYLHTINAYEKDNKIILDIAAFNDAEVMDETYCLTPIFENPEHSWPQTSIKTVTVDLNNQQTLITTCSNSLVVPRINEKYLQNKDYQFVYGKRSKDSTDFYNELVKVDVRNNSEQKTWSQHGCYPGEPVFVAKPKATSEDDGVIISVVLDAAHGNSFVLILDANNFTELARATAPHHIPFTVHGNFFENIL